MKSSVIFYFFFSFIIISAPLSAQKEISSIENEINELFKEWKTANSPGGAVGIVKDGRLIWSNAYGLASLEYDIPNTTSTIFNIASVSKQITAFSMILLEQQGKLSLDDEVSKYLEEMPDFGKKITIKHLLHHTSGLRNFQNMLAMAGWRSGESMTNEDLLRFLSQQKELNFDPGDEYLYCNTGFNICTAIVERVTGKTFQDWTKENIFMPLGMSNSSYREDLEIVHKNTATSYSGTKETGFKQPLKYWTYMGNGNVYTTVGDLAKWLANFDKPKVGGKAAIDKLVEPGVLLNREKLNYGLGIGVGAYRGLKRYSHGGSVGGYRSNMVFFPEQNIGIILITNFSTANPGAKVNAIAELLLGDQFTVAKKEATATKSSKTKVDVVDLALLDKIKGDYFVDGVVVNLTKKDNQLSIFAEGQLPAPIPVDLYSDDTFYGAQGALSFSVREANGRQNIRIRFGGETHTGFKFMPNADPEGLEGVYYSPELDTRYTIVKEGADLVVKHARHNDFKLYAANEDALVGEAYFFSNVKLSRDKKGKINGLRVSNGRVRNMWFEKL